MQTIPFNDRLVIRRGEEPWPWSIKLGDMEIAGLLAADGVKIEFVQGFAQPYPRVTLTFAEGALDLDFDADLLRELLAEKEASDA